MHVSLSACSKIQARQVLDSRGNPTVEVEVTVGEGIVGINGYTARAIVPSGASTGNLRQWNFAMEKKAIIQVECGEGGRKCKYETGRSSYGENALDQNRIDQILIDTDGTDNKSNVGANAALGVSMAVARAAAMALRIRFISIWEAATVKKCRYR